VLETKVCVQGNIVAVTDYSAANRKCHAIKVDADHWVEPETGEVHEYDHSATSRTDNAQGLRQTFAKIRALINANCTDPKKLRWITLTYAENMQDTERLYKDFDAFRKRFVRRWGKCEYISVVEPQQRGAWHVHLIGIYPDRAPYIPNDELRECWGQGFVRVESLDNIDNVGAYLSAYLADLPVDGDRGGTDKPQRDGSSKRILKGGRLSMYPKGMRIYRHSRGLRKPEEFWLETSEEMQRAHELVKDAAQTYKHVWHHVDEEGREYTGTTWYFNRVRPKTEESDCWLAADVRGASEGG
jgi:hypothetical protein